MNSLCLQAVGTAISLTLTLELLKKKKRKKSFDLFYLIFYNFLLTSQKPAAVFTGCVELINQSRRPKVMILLNIYIV